MTKKVMANKMSAADRKAMLAMWRKYKAEQTKNGKFRKINSNILFLRNFLFCVYAAIFIYFLYFEVIAK